MLKLPQRLSRIEYDVQIETRIGASVRHGLSADLMAGTTTPDWEACDLRRCSEQLQHVLWWAAEHSAITPNDNRSLDELGILVQQLDRLLPRQFTRGQAEFFVNRFPFSHQLLWLDAELLENLPELTRRRR